MNEIIQLKPETWVRIKLAAAVTGLSPSAINNLIDKKIWADGKHYRIRNGGRYINLPAYNKWVEKGV